MSSYKLNDLGIAHINAGLNNSTSKERITGLDVVLYEHHYDKVLCQAEETGRTDFTSSRHNVSRYEEIRCKNSNTMILTREFFDGSILVNDFISNRQKYCEKADGIWINI